MSGRPDRLTRPGRALGERGLALALVVFALVILGALISGAFVVSRLDRGSATNATFSAAAQEAAEAGLAITYATWDPAVQGALPVWTVPGGVEWSSGAQSVAGNPLLVRIDSVRRLNGQLFLIRSTGQRLGPAGQILASLTVGQLFRLVRPTIGVNAAITVQAPIDFHGTAFAVSGLNSLPTGWDPAACPPVDPGNTDDLVGVRSSGATGVATASPGRVVGFPAAEAPNDPTVTSATFQNFLDFSYNTLAAQPGVKVLSSSSPYTAVGPVANASTSPPSCDRASPLNFGEPYRPPAAGVIPACSGYFPVVHGTASATVFGGGGRGQGTLLVDGDLEIHGDFEWVGLVIVRGQVRISGSGNLITGALLAEGASSVIAGTIQGQVGIGYSACAVDRAIGGASRGEPIEQRSWLQLY
jgi:hypothetical protein